MKIVSLLPAATDVVHALGRSAQLVGISHACPRVAELDVPVLTRSRVPTNLAATETDACVRELLQRGEPLFELDENRLRALQPDVILTQALCNVCALDGHPLQRLAEATHLLEWSPTTLDDVVSGIEIIAAAVDADVAGRLATHAMRRRLFTVCERTSLIPRRPRVAFLEWLDPLFNAGHWIPELVQLAGGDEVLGAAGQRSRCIEPADLIAADPDVIIACCCGWSAARSGDEVTKLERHAWWQALQAVRTQRVYVVDAESTFTTPGPNLAVACEALASVLHEAPSPCDNPSKAAAPVAAVR